MHSRRRWIPILATLILILGACAPVLLDRAKQGAAVSHQIYNDLTPQVIAAIPPIVERSRAGTITDEEREELRRLNNLKGILDKYAAAHNTYVRSLQVWETRGEQPDNAILLEDQVYRLINQALDLAVELGLKVPSGLRGE